jgi:hypothetical protein
MLLKIAFAKKSLEFKSSKIAFSKKYLMTTSINMLPIKGGKAILSPGVIK